MAGWLASSPTRCAAMRCDVMRGFTGNMPEWPAEVKPTVNDTHTQGHGGQAHNVR